MPDVGTAKYLVKLRFEVDGLVEKPDIIGAIFGQTEGLFGPELNLHELQKTYKVGRIEINAEQRGDKTVGEVLVPMSTDVTTAAVVAAGVETVEKVGPFTAKFTLNAIEDVRAVKRKQISERAKQILKDWAAKTSSEGEELLREVAEVARRPRAIAFGREELPAGPGALTSGTLILVEGRADVNSLLRAGIENVVAIEGTRIPEAIIRLTRERRAIAFLDGDRAADFILRELQQVARIDAVVRAPPGREVEELTPNEIREILRPHLQPTPTPSPLEELEQQRAITIAAPIAEKVRELHPSIEGTLEAVGIDEGFKEVLRVPVSELVPKLDASGGVKHVIFDGIVTQRLVDTALRAGVVTLVGQRVGDLERRPGELVVTTFRQLGMTPHSSPAP